MVVRLNPHTQPSVHITRVNVPSDRPVGFRERGHDPVTNAFPSRLRHKFLFTADQRFSQFPSRLATARYLRQVASANQVPPRGVDLTMWTLTDPVTRKLEYVAGNVARGVATKYSLAMDADGNVCGLRGVLLADPEDGKVSSSVVTTLEDFNRENRILAKVNSRLAPRRVFVVDNKAYAEVEAMGGDGLRLFNLLDRIAGGVREEDELALKLALARGAAADLHKWHNAGVLHRDVKLANIFWTSSGDFVLGDPSLAIEAAEWPRQHLGTPMYLAPEILLGKSDDTIGAAADIFSLGMCLVAMHGRMELFPGGRFHFNEPSNEDEAAEQSIRWKDAMGDYVAWRAARSATGDPDGPLDWDRFSTDNPEPNPAFASLDTLVRDMLESCPDTTHGVFDHMLRVNPANRATAAQVEVHLNAIGLEYRHEDEFAVQTLTHACQVLDPLRERLLDAMGGYWAANTL